MAFRALGSSAGPARPKEWSNPRSWGPGESMESLTDRRKYRRIPTDQVISFAHVDTRELLGVSRNVSAGGIRFEAVGCEINLGDDLRITFNIGEHTVVVVGRVVWATEMDPITTDVGIEFLEVDSAVLKLLEDAGRAADLF